MKKFVILLFIVSLFTIFLNKATPYLAVNSEPSPCFARIKYNNISLYKSAVLDTQTSNTFCLLQEGYFVKILKEENENYFLANYLDLTGFVKKGEVECILETPTIPYPENITFYTTSQTNVMLRSEPTTKNGETSVLAVIPKNTLLHYYGKIAGEETTNQLGNIWYYCSYINELNHTNTGYVYAPLTHNLSEINENLEATNLAEYESVAKINEFLIINPNLNFIIILITILPTGLILFLFLKKSKQRIS